ncbi:transposase [Streptomyces sp. NPDC051642]|uniref:transposase n=1 Tax=unclassified Streptomyces TaxID=2593676 RepID=UPI00343F5E33
MASRLPVDVWDTRGAGLPATWLRAHPGIEVVCRDSSQTYRVAVSARAPKAIQVSDRFHLWQGLGRSPASHGDPSPGAGTAVRSAEQAWRGGRRHVNVVDMPGNAPGVRRRAGRSSPRSGVKGES